MFKRSSVVFPILLAVMLALLLYFNREELSVSSVEPIVDKAMWQLSFAHNTPEDSALHQAALRFKQQLESRAGGKIAVTIFPAQQLGNDHQMVEMARQGEIDILLTPTAKMSVPVPSMQYADLPFYFPSRDDLYHLLDGDVGALLLQDLNAIGLVGITFWENGFKHFTSNFPITTPEDFIDKKIRVMKSRILMTQFEALGATPIAIDFHKTKEALATGAVDGQENPLVAIYTMGLHEVQSHLTLSEHGYLGYVFSVSAKTFTQLPVDLRNLVVDIAREVTQWEREETQRRESDLLDKLAQSGITITTLTADQKAQFAARLAFIPTQYEHVIGANVLALSEQYFAQKYSTNNADNVEYIIGLNLDLSQNNHASSLAIKRGVEYAVAELNTQLRGLNTSIKVITLDHRDSVKKSRSNIQELLAHGNLALVIGGRESDPDMYAIDLLEPSGVLYLLPRHAYPAPVSENYAASNVLQIHFDEEPIVRFILDRALSQAKKPLILLENSPRGDEIKAALTRQLAQREVSNAVIVSLSPYQTNVDAILDSIVKERIDVIISGLNAHELTKNITDLSSVSASIPVFSVENLAPALPFISKQTLPNNFPVFYAAELDNLQNDSRGASLAGANSLAGMVFDLAQGQEELLHTYAIVKEIGQSLMISERDIPLAERGGKVKQTIINQHANDQHPSGLQLRLHRVTSKGTDEVGRP